MALPRARVGAGGCVGPTPSLDGLGGARAQVSRDPLRAPRKARPKISAVVTQQGNLKANVQESDMFARDPLNAF